MVNEPIEKARRILAELQASLRAIVDRDSEQEVRGLAVPVVDAAFGYVKEVLGDDPVVSAIGGVISVEALASAEPLRASDVLLVVDAFLGALPPKRRNPPIAF